METLAPQKHLDWFVHRLRIEADGCWQWTGTVNERGYGRAARCENGRTKNYQAHRLAYQLLVGPIPDGLTIDHLCRNRACVRPSHLEPVTMRENTLRGETIPAVNAARTHCKNGHEFTPENTYHYISKWGNPARQCLTCRKARHDARPLKTGRRNRKLDTIPYPRSGQIWRSRDKRDDGLTVTVLGVDERAGLVHIQRRKKTRVKLANWCEMYDFVSHA